jgi:crossover junction endodeoxyribonuclease RusA
MSTVRVTLPFPVSVNAMYRSVRGRVIKSARYRAWIQQAGLHINAQRPVKIVGPVHIRLDLVAPDARNRDADNLLKPVLDLLVAHQIISADDSTIVRWVHPEWADSGEPCTVTVTAINPAEASS